MKNLFLALGLLLTVGCSTTGKFNIPADHTLMVTDRTVVLNEEGEFRTSPFFWTETGGIAYRLMDKKGAVVREGKLKSQFRVASIFWPPFALIYWPMGFNSHGFDLTRPGDGYFVVDNTPTVPMRAAQPEAPAPTASEPAPAKKKKTK